MGRSARAAGLLALGHRVGQLMEHQWARIASWHIVVLHTRGLNSWVTRCGRRLDSPDVRDVFPSGEKSCENCLRLAARDEART